MHSEQTMPPQFSSAAVRDRAMASDDEASCASVVVEVLERGLVKPASPSPQAWFSLSPCDVVMREINYTRRILFYRRPAVEDDAYGLLVNTLQSSLAQTLVHFYPLAGRLALHEGRLSVHCNDKGAEFVQACMHGAPSLSQLRSSQFDMQPFFTHLCRWASYSQPLHEGSAPLLSIQVTPFACGGIALGVALSHVIADGTSFWHFMSSWAECARGKMLSLLPFHKRSLLMKSDISSSHKVIMDFFEDLQAPKGSKDEKKVQNTFCFSNEMVENLKEVTGHQYSSYEVMCAHIWKHTSQAWRHPRETRVGFINVVNMRERIDPPLPRGYFGNAILWSIATATAGELKDEDLATTAQRIHAAVIACSNSRMQEFLDLLEACSCSARKVLWPLNCNDVRMRVSSSAKFPVFRINFGWGSPLAARSATIEESNKLAFYPDTQGPGSMAICTTLPTTIMDRLKNDPSF